jgi:general secretion pathway protein C
LRRTLVGVIDEIMLRGLLIRQALIAADLVLAGLVVVMAYFVMARILEDDAATAAPVDRVETATDAGVLRKPAERGAYAGIIAGNLYGPAADMKREEPAEEEAVVEEQPLRPTTLPLKLYGTLALDPEDPLATAVIEDVTTRVKQTYYLNQPVKEGYVLREVHKRRVVLYNESTGALEELAQEDLQVAASETRSGAASARPAGRSPAGANQVVVNRLDTQRELEAMNFAEFYAQVSPQLVRDEAGNVKGITSPNIDEIPLAQRFGFQSGDIVQKINGVQIDSEQRALEVINRFQNSGSHWLTIERNGREQTLVVRVE